MSRMSKFISLLLLVLFSNQLYAACSIYAGQAVINEAYNGNRSPFSFAEIKILDNSINDVIYDSWTLKICSSSGCGTYNVNDFVNQYPWLYSVVNSSYLNFQKSKQGGGFDIMLSDGANDVIDYVSVNGFSGQSLGSCNSGDLPYYDSTVSTNNGTKLIKRDGDGTGNYEEINANDGQQTPGNNNDNVQPIPPSGFTCGIAESYSAVTRKDTFNSEPVFWKSNDFLRSVSNWPGESLYQSNGESQNISWSVNNNELMVQGAVTSGGDNEYGMVEYDLTADGVESSSAKQYSIYTDIDTNSGSSTNNDIGIVFGYQDDSNYYLARWTKVGTAYNAGIFPGAYRTLDLVKVSNSVATTLDSQALEPADQVSMMVVSSDQGVGVCTGNAGDSPSSMTMTLYSDEVVNAHHFGLYSYDNDVGIEYDNVDFRCEDCAVDNKEAIAYYSFDEEFTSGDPVLDETTNANNAISIGGISTAESGGKYCRAFDPNGTNNSNATQNALNTGLDVKDDIGTAGAISFWFNSDVHWGSGNKARVLFDASQLGSSLFNPWYLFFLEINETGQLSFTLEDSNNKVFTLTEPSSPRSANTWYYITASWNLDTGDMRLFVDGGIVAESSISSSGQLDDLNSLVFGDNRSKLSRLDEWLPGLIPPWLPPWLPLLPPSLPPPSSSNGNFDEVRIFKYALTETAIQAEMNKGNECQQTEPLFEIQHDGKGLTCLAEPITIMACADASCSSVDSSVNTDVTLLVNGGASQTVTLTAGFSSGVTFNYADTATEAELSLSSNYLCSDSSDNSTDCHVKFNNVGFVFTDGDNGNATQIGNKIAGEAFNQIKLQALEDNGSGTCQAFLADETKSVGFAMTYNAPDVATDNNYLVYGTPITKNISTTSSKSYRSIDITFDANGEATLNNVYHDAGQIYLSATYTEPPNLPLQPGFTVEGDSSSFWVRPYELTLEAYKLKSDGTQDEASPITSDTFNGTTHKAGQHLALVVKAKNKSGGITTNYKPNQNQLSVKRLAPVDTGTVDGNFTYIAGRFEPSSVLGSFSDVVLSPFTPGISMGGVSTFTGAKFSEVGVLELGVRDKEYGNQPDFHVEATPLTVGRFTPAYLTQSVSSHGEIVARDDSLMGTCGERNWAYSGQLNVDQLPAAVGAIRYAAANPPKIKIQAFNQDGGAIQNYILAATGAGGTSFMRLAQDDIVITPPTEDIKAPTMTLSSNTPLDIVNATFRHAVGGVEYTLSDDDHFTYAHSSNNFLTPFPAEFDLVIDNIEDADGIAVDTAAVVAPLPYEHIEIRTGVQVRFGRLALENSYGPETSDLSQNFKTEYLVNPLTKTFTTNISDNCTAISNVGNLLTLSDIGGGLDSANVSVVGSAGNMTLGEFKGLDLRSAKQGQIGVEFSTPAWLLFDWDENGTHDDNAQAVATFGQFRGNDRIIYWQEKNN